jgi:nucleotide-binding universal stress UspA family protein
MSGTIVCGVTGTPEGRAAAELAAALSSRLGLRLVLVHALPLPRQRPLDPDVLRERGEAEAMLTSIASGLGAPETRLVVGPRVDALAEVAVDEGADVIVVGSRQRGARGGQLRCSLARELEAAQSVPVVIAPPATRRRSDRRLGLAEAASYR